MLKVVECERYTADVFDDDLPIAKLYRFENSVLVHMHIDNYEFIADSIDTALPLIKIRWEKPKNDLVT